jgi:hypothetical protein
MLSCGVALAPAATARADAPLAETPFVATHGIDAPTCLRPSGFAGEFVTSEQHGSAGRVRLWSATTGGPVPAQVLHVPHQIGCAVVAADSQGGALLAVLSLRGARATRLLLATRPPGGRFGRLRAVGAAGTIETSVDAAIGSSGDGIVLVSATTRRGLHAITRLRALRTTAAEPIGSLQTLAAGDPSQAANGPLTDVGVDEHGRATVVWCFGTSVRSRTAASGERFGATERIHGLGRDAGSLALAVAGDGRALVATDDYDGALVAERSPGGERFGAARPLDGVRGNVALALRDDGAAFLAAHDPGDSDAGTFIRRRLAGGEFGPTQELAARLRRPEFGVGTAFVVFGGIGDVEPAAPRVVLGAAGDVVVSWLRGRGGALNAAATPWVAHGTLSDPPLTAERFGSPARAAGGSAPVLTADGRAGLAWVDGAEGRPFLSAVGDRRPGRVHLALRGGIAAASPAPPSLRLEVPRRIALYAAQPLPVRVRCGRRCDVRVTAAGAAASRTAGPATLRLALGPGPFRSVGTPDGRRVVVRAAAAAPGGVRVTRASAVAVVRRKPAPALPRVLDLRARRRGDRIVVTWRTDRPARRAYFNVFAASDGHSPPRHLLGAARGTRGLAHLRHVAVIRPDGGTTARDLRRARWAFVVVVPRDGDEDATDSAPVRIR